MIEDDVGQKLAEGQQDIMAELKKDHTSIQDEMRNEAHHVEEKFDAEVEEMKHFMQDQFNEMQHEMRQHRAPFHRASSVHRTSIAEAHAKNEHKMVRYWSEDHPERTPAATAMNVLESRANKNGNEQLQLGDRLLIGMVGGDGSVKNVCGTEPWFRESVEPFTKTQIQEHAFCRSTFRVVPPSQVPHVSSVLVLVLILDLTLAVRLDR